MKARQRLLLPLLPALPVAAAGARRWRIALVTYRGKTAVEAGFVEQLAARGLAVDYRHHDIALDPGRLPALVQLLRAERPDLVHAWGTPVTLGLAGRWDAVDPRQHLSEIPIVFSLVAAPVGAGIVPSLASSGRQLTGVSHLAPLGAQLEAMRGYAPLRRLGMLYSGNEANSLAVLAELRRLAALQGFALQAQALASDAAGKPQADGLEQGLARLKGVDWLYLPPDSFLSSIAASRLLPAAERLGLASFASTEQQMQAGALMGLVSSYRAVGQFAAHKAEQILREGREPASLPVETLSRFALQIRLPLARRLGRLPPLALFNRAEFLP